MTHLLLTLTIAMGGAEGAPASAQETVPIFRMETGEFWVNLHHFLYVLGRAEAGERDAARAAEAFGIWEGGMGRFKPALDEVWKPWLEGRGTRDAALAALAARAVIPR